MSMQFYVSPENLIKDRADFALKGISRGKSTITFQYNGGILFVAENTSRSLFKISEIYDRIGFSAVGKYNEFESLRVAGIRYADLRGYSYDRNDVSARGLANVYAQTLGAVFTQESKPYEVELVVAEIAREPEQDLLYRISFDGSVTDEQNYLVLGGRRAELTAGLAEVWRPDLSLAAGVQLAVRLLEQQKDGSSLSLATESLEVAVLERGRSGRHFHRLSRFELSTVLDPSASQPSD